MSESVNVAIATLNTLPLDAKVTVRTVWSNGKTVRNYRGQDKPGTYVVNRKASDGYRKMTMILIDENATEG